MPSLPNKTNTLDHVVDVIENEGFDYAIVEKSSYDNIKDNEFHELRTAYIDARRDLIDYLESNTDREIE